MAEGPLNGVRILDLSHVWAGPLATRLLSDLGAEVVKVERALGRGPRQALAEPIGGWLGGEPGDDPWNRSAVFVKLARNSRSLCLDLKDAPGRDVFLELVAVADVVFENFSARAMPGLGLGYEALRAANPEIIYVASPGYGTYGPYRDWVAFGPSVEPMTGLTNVLGYGPEEPRNTAMALIDPITATSAAAAIVTALRRREREGAGSYVELSLHEAGVSFHGPWILEHQLGGSIEPIGNRHPQMAPHGVYPCSGDDSWVALSCPDEAAWRGLCACIQSLDPSMMPDRRRASQDQIDAAIGAWTAERSRESAAATLQAAGVPAGPVNTTPDMTVDPQVVSRGFFVPYERFGTPIPGNPIKMSGISAEDWTPCPRLGEHNHEVLRDWLGYDEAQIDELASAGLITDRPPG